MQDGAAIDKWKLDTLDPAESVESAEWFSLPCFDSRAIRTGYSLYFFVRLCQQFTPDFRCATGLCRRFEPG